MVLRDWPRAPRQVVIRLLVVAMGTMALLVWLGWRVLGQDAELEAARRRGQLEQAADATAARVLDALDQVAQLLAAEGGGESRVILGLSLVRVSPDVSSVNPIGSLPYLPTRITVPGPPATRLQDGDRQWFLAHADAAESAYARLTADKDEGVRAAALARLAGVLRAVGRTADAGRAYDALEALGSVEVGGLPAGLVAAAGRLEMRAVAGDEQGEADRLARALTADLDGGRWPLLRDEYDYYRRRTAGFARAVPDADPDALARAAAVAWLWTNRETLVGAPRRLLSLPDGDVFVDWRVDGDSLLAVVGAKSFLESTVARAAPDGTVATVTLPPAQAAGITGDDLAAMRGVDDGLPFGLAVTMAPDGALLRAATRPILAVVLLTSVVVVTAGWFFIYRASAHEARVARMQSDFVAAVSHEFRTPLTGLGHIADMLVTNRIPDQARRQEAYEMISRDTERLRTLVENLLDLGRLEDGRARYRPEPVDLGTLVTEVVAAFNQRPGAGDTSVHWPGASEVIRVRLDREAAARALWNLLDNAMKYSPGSPDVTVELTRQGTEARLSVRDRGLGIPSAEQATIFQRFARGADATTLRISGTGIGLAMVDDIARSHGGSVRLVSEPGQGSEFTIVLPAIGGSA